MRKTTSQAICEASHQLLESDPRCFFIGEGITDHKRAFGTTDGLKDAFPDKVFEMPVSENGMTGVCVGAAISGLRPIMVHMRADFLLYAMDQIVNSAAKMHAMYGGQLNCPLVIKAVMGRGWAQGLQHSQRFERMFASIPGLKVVCPSNAYDAKGLLIWASRQNNPVIYMEHRWIHNIQSDVPDEMYEVKPVPKVIRSGCYTVAAWGYMVHECVKAAEFLSKQNITVEVIDYRGPTPSDYDGLVIEEESMCPPSPALSKGFYPTPSKIMTKLSKYYGVTIDTSEALDYESKLTHDIPNREFVGPF